MKRTLVVSITVFAFMSSLVSAEVIRDGIDMEFVTIGNAGNAADTGGTPGCGAVAYNYNIGKYEVTNAQWNAFTAAAGAPTGNPSSAYNDNAYYTGDQQPANNVSWYEAAQFCNFLTSGNKSLGAYQLGTDGSITINRAAAISTWGTAYVMPTEDEWYKAAYFKPNGSGYSFYASGLNTIAMIAAAGDGWNYCGNGYDSPWNVGTGTREQNGTFDMMGNVYEWNETLFNSSDRGHRGGAYGSSGQFLGSFIWDNYGYPSAEYCGIGFRVASIVPEPASLALLGFGGLTLLKRRRAA